MRPPSVPIPDWVNATVHDWHDGDTGHFLVTGPGGWTILWDIRLRGCNARELDEPGGQQAHDALTARLPVGTPVVLADVGPDKFGNRQDAAVFYLGDDGTVRDLTADLIAEDWAAAWNGLGKRPVPPWPRPSTPLTRPGENAA